MTGGRTPPGIAPEAQRFRGRIQPEPPRRWRCARVAQVATLLDPWSICGLNRPA
jgi:hypothetical protein